MKKNEHSGRNDGLERDPPEMGSNERLDESTVEPQSKNFGSLGGEHDSISQDQGLSAPRSDTNAANAQSIEPSEVIAMQFYGAYSSNSDFYRTAPVLNHGANDPSNTISSLLGGVVDIFSPYFDCINPSNEIQATDPEPSTHGTFNEPSD